MMKDLERMIIAVCVFVAVFVSLYGLVAMAGGL